MKRDKSANTRKSRQNRGEVRNIRDKFLQEREGKINRSPLKPMNDEQKRYIEYLNEKPIVIATGYPGTSKSYIATVTACDKYITGEIDKIYLVRPFVSKSKSPGYYAGTLEEKASIWLGEIISILKDRLEPGALETALRNGDIEFIPLEVIKGRSLKKCFVLLDEGEDITIDEARKLVTRVGKGCTMVLSGDIGQTDLKEESGLKFIKDMAENHPQLEPTVGLVDFNRPDDIVRSSVCKAWTMAFIKEGVGQY